MALNQIIKPNFDIIQLDDEEGLTELIGMFLKKHSMSFHGEPNLKAFQDFYGEGNRAKLYVIDGKFPEAPRKPVVLNGPKAISWLRSQEPNANIAYYSSNFQAYDIAKELGVHYLEKNPLKIKYFADNIKKFLE